MDHLLIANRTGSRTSLTIGTPNEHRVMISPLLWTKTRLLGTNRGKKPYECAKCNTRLAHQPFNCPECGCYQVNWVRWQDDRELIE